MTYNILFTSLYEAGKGLPVRYYCAKQGEENKFTDAVLTAEATTKRLLSSEHIDEIFVLGTFLTTAENNYVNSFDIADGKVFYDADLSTLSAVDLFRYRLAQFRDDLCLDLKNADDGISAEEQKRIEAFLQQFFETHSDACEKFNRFFERLAVDFGLYEEMKKEVIAAFPEAKGREAAYLERVRNYLYLQLRDFSKLSILKENENTKIRFFSAIDENGNLRPNVMMDVAKQFMAEGTDNVNIYIAMNNDNVEENLTMLGVLGILDMLDGERIEIRRICTPTEAISHLAGMIQDSAESYDLTSASAAVKTFLRYGKADMIVDCWVNSGSDNKQIEKMVYAMKRIDTGLSLCSITDLEKGITTLRELFKNGIEVADDDPISKLFVLMSEGIKKDYGRLVTSDDSGFIDRIKWAYSKGFYQACLTLIEAKAPKDFVNRGMFYYCNDENKKDHATELFARKRMMMKPYDYWKMEDVDHYFVKYNYIFAHNSNTLEYQRENAKNMVGCLDITKPDTLVAYTACDDRKLLEDLMFSYFRIGYIRNKTNHAEETVEEPNSLFPNEKEESSRLRDIRECIQLFIESFEKVCENIHGKDPVVVKITCDEVIRKARTLEEQEKTQRRENQN